MVSLSSSPSLSYRSPRTRKASLGTAARRESSSQSPRSSLKRGLSAGGRKRRAYQYEDYYYDDNDDDDYNYNYEEEEEGEDSNGEDELPPSMKKYRGGVKNGLGVSMKIKYQDSILYFPAFVSEDSDVVPLRVRPFSEISKGFVPFIPKDEIQTALKPYGKKKDTIDIIFNLFELN